MNYTLQLHSAQQTYPVPRGLHDLMADIAREVLRHHPRDIESFIANYLQSLINTREAARGVTKEVDDVVAKAARYKDLYLKYGITKEEADRFVSTIQAAYRGWKTRVSIKQGLQDLADMEHPRKNMFLAPITGRLGRKSATDAVTKIQATFRGFSSRKKNLFLSGLGADEWTKDWLWVEFKTTTEKIQEVLEIEKQKKYSSSVSKDDWQPDWFWVEFKSSDDDIKKILAIELQKRQITQELALVAFPKRCVEDIQRQMGFKKKVGDFDESDRAYTYDIIRHPDELEETEEEMYERAKAEEIQKLIKLVEDMEDICKSENHEEIIPRLDHMRKILDVFGLSKGGLAIGDNVITLGNVLDKVSEKKKMLLSDLTGDDWGKDWLMIDFKTSEQDVKQVLELDKEHKYSMALTRTDWKHDWLWLEFKTSEDEVKKVLEVAKKKKLVNDDLALVAIPKRCVDNLHKDLGAMLKRKNEFHGPGEMKIPLTIKHPDEIRVIDEELCEKVIEELEKELVVLEIMGADSDFQELLSKIEVMRRIFDDLLSTLQKPSEIPVPTVDKSLRRDSMAPKINEWRKVLDGLQSMLSIPDDALSIGYKMEEMKRKLSDFKSTLRVSEEYASVAPKMEKMRMKLEELKHVMQVPEELLSLPTKLFKIRRYLNELKWLLPVSEEVEAPKEVWKSKLNDLKSVLRKPDEYPDLHAPIDNIIRRLENFKETLRSSDEYAQPESTEIDLMRRCLEEFKLKMYVPDEYSPGAQKIANIKNKVDEFMSIFAAPERDSSVSPKVDMQEIIGKIKIIINVPEIVSSITPKFQKMRKKLDEVKAVIHAPEELSSFAPKFDEFRRKLDEFKPILAVPDEIPALIPKIDLMNKKLDEFEGTILQDIDDSSSTDGEMGEDVSEKPKKRFDKEDDINKITRKLEELQVLLRLQEGPQSPTKETVLKKLGEFESQLDHEKEVFPSIEPDLDEMKKRLKEFHNQVEQSEELPALFPVMQEISKEMEEFQTKITSKASDEFAAKTAELEGMKKKMNELQYYFRTQGAPPPAPPKLDNMHRKLDEFGTLLAHEKEEFPALASELEDMRSKLNKFHSQISKTEDSQTILPEIKDMGEKLERFHSTLHRKAEEFAESAKKLEGLTTLEKFGREEEVIEVRSKLDVLLNLFQMPFESMIPIMTKIQKNMREFEELLIFEKDEFPSMAEDIVKMSVEVHVFLSAIPKNNEELPSISPAVDDMRNKLNIFHDMFVQRTNKLLSQDWKEGAANKIEGKRGETNSMEENIAKVKRGIVDLQAMFSLPADAMDQQVDDIKKKLDEFQSLLQLSKEEIRNFVPNIEEISLKLSEVQSHLNTEDFSSIVPEMENVKIKLQEFHSLLPDRKPDISAVIKEATPIDAANQDEHTSKTDEALEEMNEKINELRDLFNMPEESLASDLDKLRSKVGDFNTLLEQDKELFPPYASELDQMRNKLNEFNTHLDNPEEFPIAKEVELIRKNLDDFQSKISAISRRQTI